MDEDTQRTTLDAFEATDVGLRADTISDLDGPEDTPGERVRHSTAAEIDAAFGAILAEDELVSDAALAEDELDLGDAALAETLDVDATFDAVGFLDTAALEVPARGSQARMETATALVAAPPPPRVPLPRRLPTEAGWSPPSRAARPPLVASSRRAAVFAAVPDHVPQADDDPA